METTTKIAVSVAVGFAYAVTFSALHTKFQKAIGMHNQPETETPATNDGVVYNITTLPA